MGPDCDTLIELYREDGITLVDPEAVDDNDGGNRASFLIQTLDTAGFYYVRVINVGPVFFGPDTFYDLLVWREIGPSLPGNILGVVVDKETGQEISGAMAAITNFGFASRADASGEYLMLSIPSGTYSVNVSAGNYTEETVSATVLEGQTLELFHELSRLDGSEGEGEGEPKTSGCSASRKRPFSTNTGDQILVLVLCIALMGFARKNGTHTLRHQ